MPRKKVHPDKRKRVVQACRQCKISKRKCNAALPCSHCIRRGIADACDVVEETQHEASRESTEHQNETQNTTSPVHDQPSVSIASTTHRNSSTTLVDETYNHFQPIGHPSSHVSGSRSSPETTRARMLSNNEGQYVFVGRSASLSFLQLVREVATQCIGPSEFSEHAKKDHMLEVDMGFDAVDDQEIELTASQKRHCVDNYLLATSGLMELLSADGVRKLLDNTDSGKSLVAAVRLLIIAIAHQAGFVPNSNESHFEKRAFSQARIILFAGMLENPSLDMVRAFLLLTFYMLGACRRNAAFLYLGVAARAAHTLGLHTAESYSALSETTRYAQLRCWKSLVSLDLIVCSILGRSTAVLAQRGTANTVMTMTDFVGDQISSELEATYRLAILVDTISTQFNSPEPTTAETAQLHLQHLQDWSSMLPAKLRPSVVSQAQSSKQRQSLIGCMHISCFYYFAVMLVTRPFLIMHVTQKIVQYDDYRFSIDDRQDTEQLASACLNAAVYMAQTCSDLLDLNFLLDNMCILKAWIFAAGLVLGFEMFGNRNTVPETEQASISCRRVLEKLSARSPQASEYYEILNLLSQAVDKYRQIQRSRKPQRAAPLVTRIMNLHPRSNETTTRLPNQFDGLTNDGPIDALQSSFVDSDISSTDQVFQPGFGGLTNNLDEFQFPSADNFMFDLQSIGMMPWSLS